MNSNENKSAKDPRPFIRSVFDLAYGFEDGTESVSPSEIRAMLSESGVDRDAAWSKASKMLEEASGRLKLAQARKERMEQVRIAQSAGVGCETKESLIKEITALFKMVSGASSGLYARRWEEVSAEDLAALREELKRTIEREKRRNDGAS